MHPEQLAHNAPGKLIQVGHTTEAFWHFVPDPLPPKLSYDLSFARDLAAAERAAGRLAGLGQMLENPQLFVRPFIRQEAVASSRIEGTESDLRDLLIYEASGRPRPGGPPEADVREVLNYVHALEYGLERLATLPVCLRLVREVHERLMAGVRGRQREPGEFRRMQNWIGPPGCTLRDATYVPPAPPEMRECLDALERYMHAEAAEPQLVRLALIHYQFEAIHPFLDGNGRVGRLLIALLMVHWGILPHPLLYVSRFFERHRQDYYERLLRVTTHGEWTEWVRFFLVGVRAQAEEGIRRAMELQALRARWHDEISRTRAPAAVLAVVGMLFQRPTVSIPEVARDLGMTFQRARRCVEKLVSAGILSPLSDTSNPVLYQASGLLDPMDADGET
jgi:Fic family protein